MQNTIRNCRESRGGFTLVELLVVIGIIALLISILMPALSKAREQAQRTKCLSNLHNAGLAINMYANENRQKLPAFTGGGTWLWDLPYDTRDFIIKNGSDRHMMYCPCGDWQDQDSLWWFSGQPANNQGYSVTGYFWLMKRIDGSYPTLSAAKNADYVDNIAFDRVLHKRPSDAELATDATISQNGNFGGIMGGWTNPHQTNHMGRDIHKAQGGNILYLDGHAAWLDFSAMQIRGSVGTVNFWY